eukprot:jgi/Psemu1/12567/gm1.12567_g
MERALIGQELNNNDDDSVSDEYCFCGNDEDEDEEEGIDSKAPPPPPLLSVDREGNNMMDAVDSPPNWNTANMTPIAGRYGSDKLKVKIKLMKIMWNHSIPVVAEKKLYEWIKLEGLNLFSWTKGNLIQMRSRVMKDIYVTVPEIGGDGFEPHHIDWCSKKLICGDIAGRKQIYVWSFQKVLHSLLTNVALVKEDNLSFPHAEDPTLPVRYPELQGNIHIDKLHPGQWWINTWEKRCKTDSNEILVPIILYMDEISINSGQTTLTPLNSMALGIFNTLAQNLDWMHGRLYIFTPQVHMIKDLERIYRLVAAATPSCGGKAQNGAVSTVAVTPGDVHSYTLPNDSEYKGSKGFSHILTDELITAVGRNIELAFSHQMVMGENASLILGAIPRVVDVMVNLRKVGILDANKLTTHFKDYNMKDTWHSFQRALNSVIHTDGSTGITEYTRVKGEDKLPEGKQQAVWSTNVVNYKTIMKYMKVYQSILWWYVHSVEFPPAPSNEDQGSLLYQRLQNDAGKGKQYVCKMISFFDDLLSQRTLRSFLSASYSFEQMDNTMKQIQGKEVLCQTTTAVPQVGLLAIQCDKVDLAFQKVLMFLWVQFQQKKIKKFEEVNLNHFANESFVDDNL